MLSGGSGGGLDVLGGGGGEGGGEGFAELFEAVALAGDVVAGEVAVEAGKDAAEWAGVVDREREAGVVPDGVDLVAADDFCAEGAGGPGEDATPVVERSDAPDGGHEAGLPDADAAAEREGSDFHALDARDGGGPLGPAFDIEEH
jgi:hypothetical protein